MASIESKRSLSTAQGEEGRRAQGATKSAVSTRTRRSFALPKPRVSKQGKTTTTRFPHGRTFYRFEGIKGKTVDFVRSTPWAITTRSTSASRIRPCCIS